MAQQLQGLTLLEDLGSECPDSSSKLPVTLVSGAPMPPLASGTRHVYGRQIHM